MQGLNEFIVEVGKAFKDTIKYGTLELQTEYLSKQQEQSNREGVVIATPMQINSDVKEGAQVVIDPTVLFMQSYNGEIQQSRYLVNEEKGWYRLSPDMIILYKNAGEEEWKGHKGNLFITPLKEEEKVVSGIILPVFGENPQGRGRVEFVNKALQAEGIEVGDIVYYPKDRNWKYNFQDKEYVYLRNIDILGKEV